MNAKRRRDGTRISIRLDAVPPLWPERSEAACDLARPLAELRRRPSVRDEQGDLTRAFDLGVTHFDLANNYGPPYGSAEETFGRILGKDLAAYRDELIVSTKAGYDMWPGPYGDWGSRKYLLASLDQSLARHGARLRRHLLLAPLRPRDASRGDDGRPRHSCTSGQGALRRHLVVLVRAHARRGRRSCARSGRRSSSTSPRIPCSTAGSSLTLLDTLESVGAGCIVFSPLAQGLLTDRYLDGIPTDSRALRAGPSARAFWPQRISNACVRWPR